MISKCLKKDLSDAYETDSMRLSSNTHIKDLEYYFLAVCRAILSVCF